MSTLMTPAVAASRELTEFDGHLIGPADADYEEARKVYNAMIDRHPALIARCAGPADVSRVIGFARAHDLRLAQPPRHDSHEPADRQNEKHLQKESNRKLCVSHWVQPLIFANKR